MYISTYKIVLNTTFYILFVNITFFVVFYVIKKGVDASHQTPKVLESIKISVATAVAMNTTNPKPFQCFRNSQRTIRRISTAPSKYGEILFKINSRNKSSVILKKDLKNPPSFFRVTMATKIIAKSNTKSIVLVRSDGLMMYQTSSNNWPNLSNNSIYLPPFCSTTTAPDTQLNKNL